MIITRTREHRFNTGAYEHVSTAATVELDTDELPDGADPCQYADMLLDDLLREDVRRAAQSTTTDDDRTYVHAWEEQTDAR